MARMMLAALLLAFSLSSSACVIALGKWKVSSFDEPKRPAAAKSVGAEIVDKVQREVAVHEAGHAIAMAILFGIEEVQKVVVNTNVDGDGNLGVAHWTPKIERRYREADVFNQAVVSLAGRAADILINGAATTGAGQDLAHANSVIWNAYITYGLKGSPLVYDSVGDTPPEIRKNIELEVVAAEALANGVVKANEATIRAFASDLVGIEEKDGKRIMEADVFKAFCDLHPLVDPRAPKAEPAK